MLQIQLMGVQARMQREDEAGVAWVMRGEWAQEARLAAGVVTLAVTPQGATTAALPNQQMV